MRPHLHLPHTLTLTLTHSHTHTHTHSDTSLSSSFICLVTSFAHSSLIVFTITPGFLTLMMCVYSMSSTLCLPGTFSNTPRASRLLTWILMEPRVGSPIAAAFPSFLWCSWSQAEVRECSLYASALLGLLGSLSFHLWRLLPKTR